MKKRLLNYNFILFLLVCILVGVISAGKKSEQESMFIHVGIAVYNINDTYMQNYLEQLLNELDRYDTSEKKILYEVFDAEGNLNRQQKQLQYMCSQNFDILLLNLVKPTAAAGILNEASSLNLPVILFNREIDTKDLTISNAIWYVGTDAKVAGALQGEMLTGAWVKHKEEMDQNKNGKLDYVLVEGEDNHFDTIRRTNGFMENSRNIDLNQLENISADWQRTLAYNEYSKLGQTIIDDTEAIICHNDDMALGIYDYYSSNDLEIPVIIGINNNLEMNEKIESKEIYGTVDINTEEQITYICNIVYSILEKKTEVLEKVWYSKPHAVIQ